MNSDQIIKSIYSSPVNSKNNDEYNNLSYKTNSNTPIIIKDKKETKKFTDNDFRAKYKTEICKFWQVHKNCKYGDNV